MALWAPSLNRLSAGFWRPLGAPVPTSSASNASLPLADAGIGRTLCVRPAMRIPPPVPCGPKDPEPRFKEAACRTLQALPRGTRTPHHKGAAAIAQVHWFKDAADQARTLQGKISARAGFGPPTQAIQNAFIAPAAARTVCPVPRVPRRWWTACQEFYASTHPSQRCPIREPSTIHA